MADLTSNEQWGGVEKLAQQRNDALAEVERLRAALTDTLAFLKSCCPGPTCSCCTELRAQIEKLQSLSGDPSAPETSTKPIGAQRYVLRVGHSDDAGLGGEGWVVRMSDHFSSCDTAQKWVKSEDYEALRQRFEKACSRVTELKSAQETSDGPTGQIVQPVPAKATLDRPETGGAATQKVSACACRCHSSAGPNEGTCSYCGHSPVNGKGDGK